MSRRLLHLLLARLGRSSLPVSDPVRLDLERELIDLLCPPPTVREPRRHVVWVHRDALGEADTTLPN